MYKPICETRLHYGLQVDIVMRFAEWQVDWHLFMKSKLHITVPL